MEEEVAGGKRKWLGGRGWLGGKEEWLCVIGVARWKRSG